MVHILIDSAGNDIRPKSAGQTATAAYLFVMLLGLPLAVHDGYFDVTETKHLFFLGASLLYVLITLLLCLFRRAVLPFRPVVPLRIADIGMGLFTLAFLISGLLSRDAGAWLGQSGRYQGVVTILLYALTYFCVSRNFAWTRLNSAGLLLGFGLACLLALLNDFGLDPLGIVQRLSEEQRWQFVSTLGNTNFYSAWLGTMLPVLLTLWCFIEKRGWRIATGLALFTGFCGMLPTGSESFMLALLTALWLLPLFLFQKPRAMRRYLAALLAMALTLALLRVLLVFLPHVQYLSFSMRMLTHPAVLAAIVLLCGALLLLTRKVKAPLRGRRCYLAVSLALLALFVVFLILRNTVLSSLSFGSADRFLRLDENWGTDRGRIWAYCLRAFSEFRPLAKLFGGGPGCLLNYDLMHPLFPDAYLDSAHNEYLQYLLVSGVVGLCGYLALLGGTAAAVLRRAGRSPLALAFMLGALAYAAQAFVNIAQPVSTPYLFLLLGMAAGCVAATERTRMQR